MTSSPPLSPTPRSTVVRNRTRAVTDRHAAHDLLAAGLIAHVAVQVGEHPIALPTAYAVDLAGPDDGGSLYLHGSVAARWVQAASGATVCVTVTELDGLVAARSGFHHSMNYRSVVVIGTARPVTDTDERLRALDAIVDHMIPGRSRTLRPSSRKELAATAVLAVPLREASMKARTGDPVDDPEDVATGVWAGVIPLRRTAQAPVTAADAMGTPPPADVLARAAGLA